MTKKKTTKEELLEELDIKLQKRFNAIIRVIVDLQTGEKKMVDVRDIIEKENDAGLEDIKEALDRVVEEERLRIENNLKHSWDEHVDAEQEVWDLGDVLQALDNETETRDSMCDYWQREGEKSVAKAVLRRIEDGKDIEHIKHLVGQILGNNKEL